jgi:hypothetical protein
MPDEGGQPPGGLVEKAHARSRERSLESATKYGKVDAGRAAPTRTSQSACFPETVLCLPAAMGMALFRHFGRQMVTRSSLLRLFDFFFNVLPQREERYAIYVLVRHGRYQSSQHGNEGNSH